MFFNREEYLFYKPHGDGWLIRSYTSLDGLRLLPETKEEKVVKEFPIQWSLVEDDAPGWENAWDIVDMNFINDGCKMDPIDFIAITIGTRKQRWAVSHMKTKAVPNWKATFYKLVVKRRQIG